MSPSKGNRPLVLAFTEDSILLSQLVQHFDRLSSVEIRTVASFLQLIEQHSDRHAKLIVLDADQLMEQVVPLVKILRTMDQRCKILLLLSPEHLSLCTQVLSLGMVSYLVKPVNARSVSSLICFSLNLAPQSGDDESVPLP